jgi:hypothetical protein
MNAWIFFEDFFKLSFLIDLFGQRRSSGAIGIDCFAALLAKKHWFLVICTVKRDFSIVNEADRSIHTTGHLVVCVTPIRLLGAFSYEDY